MQTPSFFSLQDFEHFEKIAYKEHDNENPLHVAAKNQLVNGVWSKTGYWAKEIEKTLPDYEVDSFKKAWFQRPVRGKSNVTIKPYTWARIIRKNASNKDVYFTLGIDSDLKIVIVKLDYQNSGNSDLTDRQKEICKQKLVNTNGWWKYVEVIPLSDLSKHNWDTLIAATAKFIKDHEETYQGVLQAIEANANKRLARLTWNSKGWVMPSGPEGKSYDGQSHEGNHGYGHEEWLLDFSKLIDDYHYGFLEPLRSDYDTYAGRSFDIQLYTINKQTKKRYWVGELKNAEIISIAESEQIKKEYKRLGWLKEMEDQIKASGANERGFSNWKGVNLFNVRFKPKDAVLYDEFIEIDPKNPLYKVKRYTFLNNSPKYQAPQVLKPFEFQKPTEAEVRSDNTDPNYSTLSKRAPRTVEIELYHKKISNYLSTHLRSVYGKKNVKAEHPAGTGSNRIDIVVQDNSDLIFYEIKTYSSIKACIREAIGQILEYSYFPNKALAKELIIVSQHEADEPIKDYMSHLRNKFDIPLYYQHFDMTKKTLSDKY
ncbi:hypothetical protein [Pontibacter virosus]|uniref:Uncharacterized protein n=1 Tax=Pontibacter virosus TaxID=1765052 RepID=A0A2U1B1F5_9BACT|nr:hypothetical protein [Pontibacter virosus]PVY42337.1 hypothetical protein C8E01_103203 [Pontibacter virosus]